MRFHASSDLEYRSGEYRLIWNIKGWSAWNYTKDKALICRDVRLPVAMEACEADKKHDAASIFNP